MTLIVLSVCWLIGVYIASLVHVEPVYAGVASLVPLTAALLWRRHERTRLAAFCLFVLAWGMVRFETSLPPPEYGSIALYIGPRPVEVGGVVVSEPDMRDKDIRLVVNTYHIGSGRDSYKVTGAVQVYVPPYGDDLLLKGTLQEPPEFDSFSYKGYLLRQGIYAIMYHPQVQVVAQGQGNRLLGLLYDVKQRLQTAIKSYLPEPQAGLVQGILLGVKAVMTDDLKEDLARTGLTHIVVVSGYNLTVVAALLQRLTERRLRRTLALLVAWLGVAAFTLMTGASPPVVRAAVMVSMALLARAVGRESDALTSLLFTAALLVGVNPMLLWHVSFQLSFLATCGLVVLAPPLERALARLPWGPGIILATTLAAQMTTLPVIAFNFQRISLISPFANLLVQPAIPLTMTAGTILALAGLSGHAVVQVIGWLTWLPSTWMVQVMRYLGGLPQAMVGIPVLPHEQQMAAIVVYFAAVALVFFVGSQVRRDGMARRTGQVREAVRGRWLPIVLLALLLVAALVWGIVVLLLRG